MLFHKTTVIASILGGLILPGTGSAADGDWQTAMLQNPSAAQLAIERRGRVFIYDGLRETDVDRVMDTQFERLENMMFIRTQRASGAGDDGVDDDC